MWRFKDWISIWVAIADYSFTYTKKQSNMDTVRKTQTSFPNCEHFHVQKPLDYPLITIIHKYISTYTILPSCENLHG